MILKLEIGKSYRTRDGGRVRIIATDKLDLSYPIVGLLLNSNETWENTYQWTAEGKYIAGQMYTGSRDLVAEWREPVEVVRWAIYNGNTQSFIDSYTHEDEALRHIKVLGDTYSVVKLTGILK